MKYITIILLFISITCQGQVNFELTKKQHFWNEAKITSIMIGEVVLSSVADGLYDNGLKLESKIVELIAKGLLVYGVREIIIQHGNFGRALIKYTSVRISLYDFSYNTTRGLPLGYIGTTSYWDKARQEFNAPLGLQCWSRAVFFTFALTFPINTY